MSFAAGNEPVAHVAEDGRCHLLCEHLKATAKLASEFADEFGSSGWARLAGLWHDLGKYSKDFQKYIRSLATGRVDHSTAGAIHSTERLGNL